MLATKYYSRLLARYMFDGCDGEPDRLTNERREASTRPTILSFYSYFIHTWILRPAILCWRSFRLRLRSIEGCGKILHAIRVPFATTFTTQWATAASPVSHPDGYPPTIHTTVEDAEAEAVHFKAHSGIRQDKTAPNLFKSFWEEIVLLFIHRFIHGRWMADVVGQRRTWINCRACFG